MLRLISCVCAVFFTLAVAADEDGFVDLFASGTLDGWTQRGGSATYELVTDAEGGLEVVGTSVANTPNTFLCTEKNYADFVLEFEVLVDSRLNSGVQFRSNAYEDANQTTISNSSGGTYTAKHPAGRVYGYQCELDPSERSWSGGVYDEARRGWLFEMGGDHLAEARDAFKRDDWNHFRVEAVGDSIRTFINGVPAADFTDDMTATGFIGLQVHGVRNAEQVGKTIRWRNVRIKELK